MVEAGCFFTMATTSFAAVGPQQTARFAETNLHPTFFCCVVFPVFSGLLARTLDVIGVTKKTRERGRGKKRGGCLWAHRIWRDYRLLWPSTFPSKKKHKSGALF